MRNLLRAVGTLILVGPVLATAALLGLDVESAPALRDMQASDPRPYTIIGLRRGEPRAIPVHADGAQGVMLLAGTWGTSPLLVFDACAAGQCARTRIWTNDMRLIEIRLPAGSTRGTTDLVLHSVRGGKFALVGEGDGPIAVPVIRHAWRPALTRGAEFAGTIWAAVFPVCAVVFVSTVAMAALVVVWLARPRA